MCRYKARYREAGVRDRRETDTCSVRSKCESCTCSFPAAVCGVYAGCTVKESVSSVKLQELDSSNWPGSLEHSILPPAAVASVWRDKLPAAPHLRAHCDKGTSWSVYPAAIPENARDSAHSWVPLRTPMCWALSCVSGILSLMGCAGGLSTNK